MFVDKWEPGVVPSKPELTSAPIWLELRNVPLQFFNEDGLERIAGLVGFPKYLHPMTANKTNLEVAKVFTVINPRKPLPEAVNVQFDSGQISRVLVSSPWMPPVCEICREIGHVSRRCPSVIKTCPRCNSDKHSLANCPQNKHGETNGKKTRRGRSKSKQVWREVDPDLAKKSVSPAVPASHTESVTATHTELVTVSHTASVIANKLQSAKLMPAHESKLGTIQDTVIGESSGTPYYLRSARQRSASGNSRSSAEIQPDSSDVETSDSDLEEGELSKHDLELGFEVVRNKKKFSGLKKSGQKGDRGRGPKLN